MIDVSPSQLETITRILSECVPDCEVRAFGSRAAWTAKDYSDLDLAVVCDRALDLDVLSRLKEAFEESDLPFRVDVLDWHAISPSFQRVIKKKYEVVQGRATQDMGATPDWPRLTLRDANITLIDCDHRTPPAAESGYPYVAIPQLRGGRIDLSGVRRIKSEDFIEWTRKAKPTANDVILSRRCNPGETAVVPPNFEFALGQNLVLLRADGTKVYPPFLRWLVRGPEWWTQIRKFMNVGAVFDSLRCADVPNFTLCIPPIPEQRAIAHILGSLDDKIELNRRTCETLEATARALFKSWFVDFDPVRAKAEGRDTGLPKSIADLFPDSFEESALGEVPKGWRIGVLGDVAMHPRRVVQHDKVGASTPYIALEHMPRHCIGLSDWGIADGLASNKFAFMRGEILFGKLRPYFHKVGVAPVDGVCSTDIVVIAPRENMWFSLVLCYASSDAFVEYTNAGATGTKMPRTSWDYMARYPIVIPPKTICEAFGQEVRHVTERILSAICESRSLAAIRDALLPKIISGELRVRDVARLPEGSAGI